MLIFGLVEFVGLCVIDGFCGFGFFFGFLNIFLVVG